MREYSVSLRKSEFAVASDAPMNTCAPGKIQGISKQAATVVPSEYVEIITADFYNQNHKGVKKEYENEVKKDHDIGVKNDYINEVKKEPNNEVKKEPDNEDSAPDMDVGRNMKLKQNPLTVMSSDEVQENDFIIKKEDKVFEVTIKQELDVGPTVLQPRSTLYPHQLFAEAHPSTPWPSTSSGCQTTSAPFDRCPVTSSLRVKVEDHHYENSREGYVDSNYWQVSNTGLYVGERTSQESAFRSMEAQMEGQCTYCMEVLKHYECRTKIPNNTYTDGQKYECEYCGFKTNIDVDFVKSIRSCMNKKSYKCHLCEYNASQLSHLQSHMRKHTGEKPYKCNYCEYSASQFCSLQRHTRRHTGEKPYKCKQCDYSTSYLYSLQTHMRTHTGEKPYKCVHCEYSASESSKLKRHMRLHTGEKPYKCKQCDYSTSRLNYLKTHMRRHTGEKPYSCDKCDYNASQLGNLKRHMRVHMSEKSYAS